MGAPLNIRDPRARELARQLAGQRKVTITDAVISALEHELAREKARVPLADRLGSIAAAAQAGATPAPGPTEAERDAMWTR